jgi:hypothetical protein
MSGIQRLSDEAALLWVESGVPAIIYRLNNKNHQLHATLICRLLPNGTDAKKILIISTDRVIQGEDNDEEHSDLDRHGTVPCTVQQL